MNEGDQDPQLQNNNQNNEGQPLVQQGQEQTAQEVRLKIPTNLDEYDQETAFHCIKCGTVEKSQIKYSYGPWTYLCCCIWCFLTIVGGLVPFCCRPCQDKTHYCGKCNEEAGKRQFKPCNWF